MWNRNRISFRPCSTLIVFVSEVRVIWCVVSSVKKMMKHISCSCLPECELNFFSKVWRIENIFSIKCCGSEFRSGLYVNYGERIVFCTSYQILVCTFYTLNWSIVSYSQSNIVEFLWSCTASHFLFRVCFSTAGWYMLPTCTYRIVLIIEACLAIFVSNEIQLKCYFLLLFLFVH